MSYTDTRHNIELCPNRGLSILTCGWMKCDPCHHCPKRFYPDHSFTFVLKGRGYYTIGNRTFTIQAGECFCIFPNISITYTADAENPWEYIFAIVSGEDVLPLIKAIGVTPENPVVPYDMTSEMSKNLKKMCEAGASGKRLGYDVIGHFLLCMSNVINKAADASSPEHLQDVYVEKSIAYMKTNYPYDISIAGVAVYVGIEYSYLYRLFKMKTGISPREWLINYRLEQARDLMRSECISFTEIAHSVGFYDLSHFTKSFVNKYHITPTDYRRTLHRTVS